MIYVLLLWDKRDKYYADNSMEKQKATQKSALSVFSVGQMLVRLKMTTDNFEWNSCHFMHFLSL